MACAAIHDSAYRYWNAAAKFVPVPAATETAYLTAAALRLVALTGVLRLAGVPADCRTGKPWRLFILQWLPAVGEMTVDDMAEVEEYSDTHWCHSVFDLILTIGDVCTDIDSAVGDVATLIVILFWYSTLLQIHCCWLTFPVVTWPDWEGRVPFPLIFYLPWYCCSHCWLLMTVLRLLLILESDERN